ncbi:hypothetical protein KAR34_09595 [bacterium]|nr:hypothetical protein [bacterium]
MGLLTSWSFKSFLLRAEFTVKSLLKLASPARQSEALTWLAKNNMVEVISLSPDELDELRVEIPKGVELLSTSLESAGGKSVFVLVAPEGRINPRLLRKITLLPTEFIAGATLSVLESPDQVVQAIEKISSHRAVKFAINIFYLPVSALNWLRAGAKALADRWFEARQTAERESRSIIYQDFTTFLKYCHKYYPGKAGFLQLLVRRLGLGIMFGLAPIMAISIMITALHLGDALNAANITALLLAMIMATYFYQEKAVKAYDSLFDFVHTVYDTLMPHYLRLEMDLETALKNIKKFTETGEIDKVGQLLEVISKIRQKTRGQGKIAEAEEARRAEEVEEIISKYGTWGKSIPVLFFYADNTSPEYLFLSNKQLRVGLLYGIVEDRNNKLIIEAGERIPYLYMAIDAAREKKVDGIFADILTMLKEMTEQSTTPNKKNDRYKKIIKLIHDKKNEEVFKQKAFIALGMLDVVEAKVKNINFESPRAYSRSTYNWKDWLKHNNAFLQEFPEPSYNPNESISTASEFQRIEMQISASLKVFKEICDCCDMLADSEKIPKEYIAGIQTQIEANEVHSNFEVYSGLSAAFKLLKALNDNEAPAKVNPAYKSFLEARAALESYATRLVSRRHGLAHISWTAEDTKRAISGEHGVQYSPEDIRKTVLEYVKKRQFTIGGNVFVPVCDVSSDSTDKKEWVNIDEIIFFMRNNKHLIADDWHDFYNAIKNGSWNIIPIGIQVYALRKKMAEAYRKSLGNKEGVIVEEVEIDIDIAVKGIEEGYLYWDKDINMLRAAGGQGINEVAQKYVREYLEKELKRKTSDIVSAEKAAQEKKVDEILDDIHDMLKEMKDYPTIHSINHIKIAGYREVIEAIHDKWTKSGILQQRKTALALEMLIFTETQARSYGSDEVDPVDLLDDIKVYFQSSAFGNRPELFEAASKVAHNKGRIAAPLELANEICECFNMLADSKKIPEKYIIGIQTQIEEHEGQGDFAVYSGLPEALNLLIALNNDEAPAKVDAAYSSFLEQLNTMPKIRATRLEKAVMQLGWDKTFSEKDFMELESIISKLVKYNSDTIELDIEITMEFFKRFTARPLNQKARSILRKAIESSKKEEDRIYKIGKAIAAISDNLPGELPDICRNISILADNFDTKPFSARDILRLRIKLARQTKKLYRYNPEVLWLTTAIDLLIAFQSDELDGTDELLKKFKRDRRSVSELPQKDDLLKSIETLAAKYLSKTRDSKSVKASGTKPADTSSGEKSEQLIHKRDLKYSAILALIFLAVGIWQTASSGFGLLPGLLFVFSFSILYTFQAKWRGLQGKESTALDEELKSPLVSHRAHALAHEYINNHKYINKIGAAFGIKNLSDFELPVHMVDFLFCLKAYRQIRAKKEMALGTIFQSFRSEKLSVFHKLKWRSENMMLMSMMLILPIMLIPMNFISWLFIDSTIIALPLSLIFHTINNRTNNKFLSRLKKFMGGSLVFVLAIHSLKGLSFAGEQANAQFSGGLYGIGFSIALVVGWILFLSIPAVLRNKQKKSPGAGDGWQTLPMTTVFHVVYKGPIQIEGSAGKTFWIFSYDHLPRPLKKQLDSNFEYYVIDFDELEIEEKGGKGYKGLNMGNVFDVEKISGRFRHHGHLLVYLKDNMFSFLTYAEKRFQIRVHDNQLRLLFYTIHTWKNNKFLSRLKKFMGGSLVFILATRGLKGLSFAGEQANAQVSGLYGTNTLIGISLVAVLIVLYIIYRLIRGKEKIKKEKSTGAALAPESLRWEKPKPTGPLKDTYIVDLLREFDKFSNVDPEDVEKFLEIKLELTGRNITELLIQDKYQENSMFLELPELKMDEIAKKMWFRGVFKPWIKPYFPGKEINLLSSGIKPVDIKPLSNPPLDTRFGFENITINEKIKTPRNYFIRQLLEPINKIKKNVSRFFAGWMFLLDERIKARTASLDENMTALDLIVWGVSAGAFMSKKVAPKARSESPDGMKGVFYGIILPILETWLIAAVVSSFGMTMSMWGLAFIFAALHTITRWLWHAKKNGWKLTEFTLDNHKILWNEIYNRERIKQDIFDFAIRYGMGVLYIWPFSTAIALQHAVAISATFHIVYNSCALIFNPFIEQFFGQWGIKFRLPLTALVHTEGTQGPAKPAQAQYSEDENKVDGIFDNIEMMLWKINTFPNSYIVSRIEIYRYRKVIEPIHDKWKTSEDLRQIKTALALQMLRFTEMKVRSKSKHSDSIDFLNSIYSTFEMLSFSNERHKLFRTAYTWVPNDEEQIPAYQELFNDIYECFHMLADSEKIPIEYITGIKAMSKENQGNAQYEKFSTAFNLLMALNNNEAPAEVDAAYKSFLKQFNKDIVHPMTLLESAVICLGWHKSEGPPINNVIDDITKLAKSDIENITGMDVLKLRIQLTQTLQRIGENSDKFIMCNAALDLLVAFQAGKLNGVEGFLRRFRNARKYYREEKIIELAKTIETLAAEYLPKQSSQDVEQLLEDIHNLMKNNPLGGEDVTLESGHVHKFAALYEKSVEILKQDRLGKAESEKVELGKAAIELLTSLYVHTTYKTVDEAYNEFLSSYQKLNIPDEDPDKKRFIQAAKKLVNERKQEIADRRIKFEANNPQFTKDFAQMKSIVKFGVRWKKIILSVLAPEDEQSQNKFSEDLDRQLGFLAEGVADIEHFLQTTQGNSARESLNLGFAAVEVIEQKVKEEMDKKSPYAVLGASSGNNMEVFRNKWRVLSKKYLPNQTDGFALAIEAMMFIKGQDAYEELKNKLTGGQEEWSLLEPDIPYVIKYTKPIELKLAPQTLWIYSYNDLPEKARENLNATIPYFIINHGNLKFEDIDSLGFTDKSDRGFNGLRNKAVFLVGRKTAGRLGLHKNKFISGEHLTVMHIDGLFYFTDLRSTNGTKIRIPKKTLLGGKSELLKMWTLKWFGITEADYEENLVFIETAWSLAAGLVGALAILGCSLAGWPIFTEWLPFITELFPTGTVMEFFLSTLTLALIAFPFLHLDKVFNWVLDKAPHDLNRLLSPVFRTEKPTPLSNAVIAALISAAILILMHYLTPVYPIIAILAGIVAWIVLHVKTNIWFAEKDLKTHEVLIDKATQAIGNEEYDKAFHLINQALVLINNNTEWVSERMQRKIYNILDEISEQPNAQLFPLMNVWHEGLKKTKGALVEIKGKINWLNEFQKDKGAADTRQNIRLKEVDFTDNVLGLNSIIADRYVLLDRIGGYVAANDIYFEAWDEIDEKNVFIMISNSREQFDKKMLNEYLALTQLDGIAGIPKAHFAGHFQWKEQECAFCVIDKVKGNTLESILKEIHTTEKQVIRIASKIFNILDEIHALGFTHNAINAGSIMISSREPSLINFSQAKRSTDEDERKEDINAVIELIREMMKKIPERPHSELIMHELDKLKATSPGIEEVRAVFGKILHNIELNNLPEKEEGGIYEYGVPIGKRNSYFDTWWFLFLRQGAALLLGVLFIVPSIGATYTPLSVKKINNCPQMLAFKLSHGMTSPASIIKDNPENITLKQVDWLEFMVRTVLGFWQNENEFYATRGMLAALDLDTLNKKEKGMSLRSSLAKQLLILSLEHQSKRYERTIKWQVRFVKWGLNPSDKIKLYKEEVEEAEEIKKSQKDATTYTEHYTGKDSRDLTPTDLGRLFEELTADINTHQAETVEVKKTDKKKVRDLLKDNKLLGRKDGNEKLLAALESDKNTLWQVLLQEFRGQSGEDLVAANVVEAVLKSLQEKDKDADKQNVKRMTEKNKGVKEIYAVAAPAAVEFMNKALENISIENNSELQTRVKNFKALLEALPTQTQSKAGQLAELDLSDEEVRSAVAGELDRLHAKDEALAAEIGKEEDETVYSVCDAKRKIVTLKTTAGKERVVLAANIGEVIDKTLLKEKIMKKVNAGTLKWFEFKGRETKMTDEIEPNIIEKIGFAVLMLFVPRLPAGVKNIIMPQVLKDKACQIANINRAADLAKRDLEEKDGFKDAGINIDKIALAEEFRRPNSYLRQQYRRMAQNPGDLKLQAEFARSIVRFMTKYEEIHINKTQADTEGWTAKDRNRMIIMYATRLVENLNSIPIIENLAHPETGYEVLENKWGKRYNTKPLGNVSILAILFPKALNEKQKGVLGMRGTAGILADYLERNHFIIDDNIREKHFKRMFKLLMGAAA